MSTDFGIHLQVLCINHNEVGAAAWKTTATATFCVRSTMLMKSKKTHPFDFAVQSTEMQSFIALQYIAVLEMYSTDVFQIPPATSSLASASRQDGGVQAAAQARGLQILSVTDGQKLLPNGRNRQNDRVDGPFGPAFGSNRMVWVGRDRQMTLDRSRTFSQLNRNCSSREKQGRCPDVHTLFIGTVLELVSKI